MSYIPLVARAIAPLATSLRLFLLLFRRNRRPAVATVATIVASLAAALHRRVAAPRLATVAVAAVIVAIVVARVAATRHCLSAVASRLVTRRSHTVVAARRQVCRYLIVVTLLAAVLALALALPSAPLPRARNAAAPAGRARRARRARPAPIYLSFRGRRDATESPLVFGFAQSKGEPTW